MVDEGGQLYTIEGISAALIMLVTVYIVLSTTTLYTPTETHVNDLQLEQLGSDTLAMMDTANGINAGPNVFVKKESDLEKYIVDPSIGNIQFFNLIMDDYLNKVYNDPSAEKDPDIAPVQWKATIYYRDVNGQIASIPYTDSSGLIRGRAAAGNENFVRITRLIHVPANAPILSLFSPPGFRNVDQVILLEVLLWRN
jgi:hypothetical protein